MKLQFAALIVTLCGAALAAPAHKPLSEKRFWPIPFPHEGIEPGPEPSTPALRFPFPNESGESSEHSEFPRPWPPRPFAGSSCGESPIESLSELREQLPWGQSGSDQEDGESGGIMMEDANESVLAGEGGQGGTGNFS